MAASSLKVLSQLPAEEEEEEEEEEEGEVVLSVSYNSSEVLSLESCVDASS